MNLPLQLKILKIANERNSNHKRLPLFPNIHQLKLRILIINNVTYTQQNQFKLLFDEMINLKVPDGLVTNQNEFKFDEIKAKHLLIQNQSSLQLSQSNSNNSIPSPIKKSSQQTNVNNSNNQTQLSQISHISHINTSTSLLNQSSEQLRTSHLQTQEIQQENELDRKKREEEIKEIDSNIKYYEERILQFDRQIEQMKQRLSQTPQFIGNPIQTNPAFLGTQKRITIELENRSYIEKELAKEKHRKQVLLEAQHAYVLHQMKVDSNNSKINVQNNGNSNLVNNKNETKVIDLEKIENNSNNTSKINKNNQQQININNQNNQNKQKTITQPLPSSSTTKSKTLSSKTNSTIELNQTNKTDKTNKKQTQQQNNTLTISKQQFEAIQQSIPQDDYTHFIPSFNTISSFSQTNNSTNNNNNNTSMKRYEYLNGSISTISLSLEDICK